MRSVLCPFTKEQHIKNQCNSIYFIMIINFVIMLLITYFIFFKTFLEKVPYSSEVLKKC